LQVVVAVAQAVQVVAVVQVGSGLVAVFQLVQVLQLQ
jgi:hypothetical protein